MRDLPVRIAEARAAWPGVDLDPAEFEAYVTERGGDTEDLCTSDLWLAAACAKGDRAAIAAFDTHYMKQIGPALAPLRLGREQIEDVTQELRSKLLIAEGGEAPRIADYGGRAALRIWIRTAAVRTALEMMRKKRESQLDDDTLAALPAIDDDPELLHARDTYQAELKTAFTEAIGKLEPRDRTLLKYQFVDGLSIDKIGAIYGVHRATAARWVGLARDKLGKIVHRELRDKLKVTQSEVASIARLVESHIDLSVRRLLR